MIDRKKVIQSLEYCATHDCSILCPSWIGCDQHSLVKDALELLKEQQEQIELLEHDLAITTSNLSHYVNGND